MKRTGKANWNGDLQTGLGVLTSQSGILNATPYSFKTRFGDGNGTNPEELLATAHAGCFTMSVSLVVGEAGFKAGNLHTEAVLELDMQRLQITGIQLNLVAEQIAGLSEPNFNELVEVAKSKCILSNALSVPIAVSVVYEAG
ncbi:MAG: OsmC family peroxiredoxin [Chitinophagaceae bacterium]|nr:MAG: OsmC family peroxiredoxin [Chitinophagaceae bacterium]